MTRAKRNQQPTCTSLVYNVLKARGEFTDTSMLKRMTGCSTAAVHAALHHMRKHRAVDVVVENDGTGWWFATPESDTRQYTHEQRACECNPRKPRRKKAVTR